MQQRTGSVYLDAPTRPSRVETGPDRSLRARGGAVAVGLGVVAITIALLITGIRILVLDDEPTLRALESTLDDPIAREEIEREIAADITNEFVGDEMVAIAAAFDLNVADEARRVSTLIVDDERVRAELRLVAADIHRRVLLEPDATEVDVEPLSDAVLAVVDVGSPRLGALMPADTPLWLVPGDSLPDYTGAADLADRLLRYCLLAALLVPIGLAVHPKRHVLAGWIGRWIVGCGLVCAIAAVALPYLIGELTGYRTVEIAIRSVSLKLLAPAVLSGILGLGLTSFASVLRTRDRRRITDEGAAAALGYDEPPFWQQTPSPTLDLPSRGLVDAGHPLTNI